MVSDANSRLPTATTKNESVVFIEIFTFFGWRQKKVLENNDKDSNDWCLIYLLLLLLLLNIVATTSTTITMTIFMTFYFQKLTRNKILYAIHMAWAAFFRTVCFCRSFFFLTPLNCTHTRPTQWPVIVILNNRTFYCCSQIPNNKVESICRNWNM